MSGWQLSHNRSSIAISGVALVEAAALFAVAVTAIVAEVTVTGHWCNGVMVQCNVM